MPNNNQITIPYNFTPRPYQLEFFQIMDSGCRRYFSRWTRRAGKDVAYWNFVIKEAFTRVGNYYYVFPEYGQGKKALWEGKTKHQQMYLDYIPKEWIKSKNANEMKVTLFNGSVIRIIGSSDIDKLRGSGPCGIVISEFAYHDAGLGVLEVLTPMLSENDGWLIINSTPCGKNFMYDFEMSIKGNPEWHISEIQSLWPDLPNYYPVYSKLEDDRALEDGRLSKDEFWKLATQRTSEVIESERAIGKTEESIEQEYGVSYIAGQKGAYYSDCVIKARKEGRIGNFPPSDHKWTDVFLDLGWKDDTACWFRQVDGGRLIWIDYYENNTKDIAFYVEMLRSKGYKYRSIYLPHDGKNHSIQTGMRTCDLFTRLLQEAGIKAEVINVERPSSEQLAINLTRERFSRYHFNEPLVADGITKVSLYHREYDKKNGVFRDKPKHDWTSHAADSLAIDGITANMNESYGNIFNSFNIVTDFNPLDYED